MNVIDVTAALVHGVASEGSSSVNIKGALAPTTGYMVGGHGTETIIEYGYTKAFAELVAGYVVDHVESTLSDHTLYYGAWRQADGGKDNVYLDISKYYTDDQADEALRDARERGQLAMWDLERGKEVWVEHHRATGMHQWAGNGVEKVYEEELSTFVLDQH
jgi:hypothetical protein